MSSTIFSGRVDGLLFDSDGVLVDSHDAAAAVWNQWALSWCPGFDFHRDIQHGKRLVDVVADLVSPDTVDAAARALADMELTSATKVPAVAGARELLAAIPSHKWAVVTSGRREMALRRLNAAGLPQPQILITAEDVRCGKPAPDPYLTGAERLGLDPEQCAVFEDAPLGIEAARAAGVRFVIGIGHATVGHDVTISVPDLAGTSFDGQHLVVTGDTCGIEPSDAVKPSR